MKAKLNFLWLSIPVLLIVACQKEDPEELKSGNTIIEFYISSFQYKAPVNETEKTITLIVPANVDLGSIKPKITISEGATVSPPSFEEVDLSAPFEYEVTAEDGGVNIYTVFSEQLTDTAFLIIDVQNGWAFETYCCDDILDNINIIADKARQAGKPVIYVYDYSDYALNNYTGWELEIVEEISPHEGDYVIGKKNVMDVFDESVKVMEKLNKLKVGVVVLSGMVTQSCVHASCIGSVDRGYKVFMASDCHTNTGTFNNLAFAAGIIEDYNAQWADYGAILVKAEDITF